MRLVKAPLIRSSVSREYCSLLLCARRTNFLTERKEFFLSSVFASKNEIIDANQFDASIQIGF